MGGPSWPAGTGPIGNSTYPADEHNLQTLKGRSRTSPCSTARSSTRPRAVRRRGRDIAARGDLRPGHPGPGPVLRSAARDDVLLVYFSGHGKLDQGSRLHLCMQDTESTDLLSTAVSSVRINEFADASHARNVVIVLDCCHAGAFRGGELGDAVAGPGRYVPDQLPGNPAGQRRDGGQRTSFFTQHLVDGLLDAAADQDRDGYVTFSDLYAYVDRRLREAASRYPSGGWRAMVTCPWPGARHRHPRKALLPAGQPHARGAPPWPLKGPPAGGPPPAAPAVAGDGTVDAAPTTDGPQSTRTRRKVLVAAAVALAIAWSKW